MRTMSHVACVIRCMARQIDGKGTNKFVEDEPFAVKKKCINVMLKKMNIINIAAIDIG